MIEITHRQARKWMFQALDAQGGAGQVPEVQWAALQSHLEICVSCRAHQRRLLTLEKDMRRAMQATWSVAQGPGQNLAEEIMRRFERRSQVRRRIQMALAVMALVLLAAGVFSQLQKVLAEQESAPGTPLPVEAAVIIPVLPEPQPTAQPGEFSDVVVFQSLKDGNSEIYLLNSGGEPVNLTNDPAHDSHPAWSPNAEWIAYLSDRTGKREIYVLNITSRRVIQLTHHQEIDWQGPMSWSPDGKWIGLTGLRLNQANQPWVYLVPVEGQQSRSPGPIAVEGSRGGWSPEFTRPMGRLAFLTWDGIHTGITVLERDTGRRETTSWEGGSEERIRSGTALDWMGNGSGLAFLSGSPLGEQAGSDRARVDAVLAESFNHNFDLQEHIPVAVSRWPQAFSSVTWNMNGEVIYLEDLGDARANDLPGRTPGACWTLQIRRPGTPSQMVRPALPNNLCIEGGLDSSSWTSDRRWLVVRARPPGEYKQALYAIGMSGRQSALQGDSQVSAARHRVGTVLRLTDEAHPFEAWTAALEGSLPRVRPRGSPVEINPKPVQISQQLPAPAVRQQSEGKIVFSLNRNGVSVLARANPDGTGGFVVLATRGNNHCPVWSPDGNEVAYITANRTESEAEGQYSEALYRTSEDGKVTNLVVNGSDLSAHSDILFNDCPVWSPDGRWLAGLVRAGEQDYLMIAPAFRASGQPPVWYEISSPASAVAWTHDSTAVLAAYRRPGGTNQHLMMVEVAQQYTRAMAEVTHFEMPFSDGEIYDLSADPNSMQVAMLATIRGRNNRQVAVLRLMSLTEDNSHLQLRLSEVPEGLEASPGEITWLADGAIGLILHGPVMGRYKNLILRYDPQLNFFNTLALVEDRIYSAAWSADGTGMIYSAESGLWLLDVRAAQAEKDRPVWLSPEPVYDLDWAD